MKYFAHLLPRASKPIHPLGQRQDLARELSPWRETDLEPFAALNADPVVMEHFAKPLDRSESDAFVARIGSHFIREGFGFWAVEAPGVSPLIGLVGLAKSVFEAPFTPCVEIGWRLARDHWGKGYATELGVEGPT